MRLKANKKRYIVITALRIALSVLALLAFPWIEFVAASPQDRSGAEQSTEGLYRKGLDYLKRQQYFEAVETFTKAIDHGSQETGLYVGRGEALYKLKRHEEALRDVSRAINDKPYHFYGYLLRAAIYEGLDKLQEAVDDLTAAVRIHPENSTAYYARSAGYLKLGRFDEALRDVDTAIRLGAGEETLENRALILEKLGRYQEAIVDWVRLLANQPKHTAALFHRGWCYLCVRDMERALADFNLVLEKHPNEMTYILRGWVHLEMKRYEAALEDFNKALRINPKSRPAHLNLATLYFAKGEYEAAHASNASALDGSIRNSLQVEMFFQKGLILIAMNEPSEAEEAYRKGGQLAQQLGDVEALEYALEDLSELAHNVHPSSKDTLGSIIIELRKLKDQSAHSAQSSLVKSRGCRLSFI